MQRIRHLAASTKVLFGSECSLKQRPQADATPRTRLRTSVQPCAMNAAFWRCRSSAVECAVTLIQTNSRRASRPQSDKRKPFSAQYDPPIDGGAYCPDALYVIDDLVGNGRRVGGRQDRLGIAEADVIVPAASHEIAGRDRIGFVCIERRIADLDR